MDDEEVNLQLQATPTPRKGKAARALLATPATCHSVWLHAKQLARGEGSVDSSPAVPGSYGVDIASGKSASVVNAHSDIGLQEYALYTRLEDIMAAALHDAEGDPKLLQEVQSHTDWPSWKAAMDCKMEMLENHLEASNLPTRQECHRMQVGLHNQMQSQWEHQEVQGMACHTWIHADPQSGLL